MRPPRFLTDAERQAIAVMLADNMSIPQISKVLRASNSWVAQQVKVIKATLPKSGEWPAGTWYEDDPAAAGDPQ